MMTDFTIESPAHPKNIVDHQLPPLAGRWLSSSTAHVPIDREPATLTETTLQIVPGNLLKEPSTLWRKKERNPRYMWWCNEMSIRDFVKLALEDVLDAADLYESISVESELTLFPADMNRQRSDLYLLKSNGMPIGVVEVKAPVTDDILNNEKVHGQMYDYLMALRSFSGVQCPFGILTSYEGWRVCWLPEAQTLAKAEQLPPPHNKKFELWEYLPDTPQWHGKVSTDQAHVETPNGLVPTIQNHDNNNATPDLRNFFGTKTYRHDDSELINVLASTIKKMDRSPIQWPNNIKDRLNGTGLLVNESTFQWGKIPFNDITFNSEITGYDKQFWLLADLHGGADGNVWLASTNAGKGCVVKFSLQSDDAAKHACEREAEIWTKVWRRRALVRQLHGKYAVAMPYVKPCSDNEKPFSPSDAVKMIAMDAIDQLSRFGIRHDDLRWSHVGTYRDENGTEKAVLFDLARVSHNINPQDAKDFMAEKLGLM